MLSRLPPRSAASPVAAAAATAVAGRPLLVVAVAALLLLTVAAVADAGTDVAAAVPAPSLPPTPPPLPPAEPCPAGQLAAYRVTMHTFWTRDRFPRHYPEWRPPAHWSRMIGFSHGPAFVLFRVGTRASAGVRQLAETGRVDALFAASPSVAQGGAGGVFDEFSAPALSAGAGRADALFFADANHSRVSLMARMVPSPDWFVGLDSFELCVGGAWLDSITLEADPLDAGTDNGFTFTAPNWPTEPQGTVYRVTNRYPPHPAGSFYYPALRRLPPIAAFTFRKVREFELSSEAGAEALAGAEVPPLRPAAPPPPPPPRGDADLQAELAEEAREMEIANAAAAATTVASAAPPQRPRPLPLPPIVVQTGPSKILSKSTANATVNSATTALDSGAWYNSVAGMPPSAGKPRKKHWRSMRPARDCRVGEWAAWGPCSRSCGIGETQRCRPVLRPARRGGRPCPALLQTKWCGSARDCPSGDGDDGDDGDAATSAPTASVYFRW